MSHMHLRRGMSQLPCSSADNTWLYMHIICQYGYYVVIYGLYMQRRRGGAYLQYKNCRHKFLIMSLYEKETECASTSTTCYVVMHASYICSQSGVVPVYDKAIQANNPKIIPGLETKETKDRPTTLLVLIIIISEGLTCRSLPVRVVF